MNWKQRWGLWLAAKGGWRPINVEPYITALKLAEATVSQKRAELDAARSERADLAARKLATEALLAKQGAEAREAAKAAEETLNAALARINELEHAAMELRAERMELAAQVPVLKDRAAAAEGALTRSEKARAEADAARLAAELAKADAMETMKSYTVSGLAPLLWHRAKQLVAQFSGNHGVSGDYKRHQVKALLVKEFPQENKKDVGLAIELAVR